MQHPDSCTARPDSFIRFDLNKSFEFIFILIAMKCYHGFVFSCSSGTHTECLDGYESVDFEGEHSVFLSLPHLPRPSVNSSAFSLMSQNPQLFTFTSQIPWANKPTVCTMNSTMRTCVLVSDVATMKSSLLLQSSRHIWKAKWQFSLLHCSQ